MDERSRHNTFAALDLDRRAEFRDDAQGLAERRSGAAARHLVLRPDGHALVDAQARALRLLDAGEHGALFDGHAPANYLGSDAVDWFALEVDPVQAERVAQALGARFLDLRGAGLALPAFDAGLFAYALGLANWQRRLRFCHACAAPVRFEAAGHRAKCTNPQCALEHFPRTDPAVIVIVTSGADCLLGRGANWPARRYSTLAGFVEPGETLEDAVRREVAEEAGVRVGDCAYHSSQPWPFPASIMLGFSAHALDRTIALGRELADARWFSPRDFVSALEAREITVSPPLSVSYRLIEHWLARTAGLDLAHVVANAAPSAKR